MKTVLDTPVVKRAQGDISQAYEIVACYDHDYKVLVIMDSKMNEGASVINGVVPISEALCDFIGIELKDVTIYETIYKDPIGLISRVEFDKGSEFKPLVEGELKSHDNRINLMIEMATANVEIIGIAKGYKKL
jgi:hypothetical protein